MESSSLVKDLRALSEGDEGAGGDVGDRMPGNSASGIPDRDGVASAEVGGVVEEEESRRGANGRLDGIVDVDESSSLVQDTLEHVSALVVADGPGGGSEDVAHLNGRGVGLAFDGHVEGGLRKWEGQRTAESLHSSYSRLQRWQGCKI